MEIVIILVSVALLILFLVRLVGKRRREEYARLRRFMNNTWTQEDLNHITAHYTPNQIRAKLGYSPYEPKD